MNIIEYRTGFFIRKNRLNNLWYYYKNYKHLYSNYYKSKLYRIIAKAHSDFMRFQLSKTEFNYYMHPFAFPIS